MKWKKETAWNLLSECGAFRINKALVGGEPLYQAVQVFPPPPVIVLGRGTLDEAKAACKGKRA